MMIDQITWMPRSKQKAAPPVSTWPVGIILESGGGLSTLSTLQPADATTEIFSDTGYAIINCGSRSF